MLAALLLSLATFAAAVASDVVEAYFVRAVAELRPHLAAAMSVSMYLMGFVGWAITIKVSLWYCVPEVLGLYVGSLVAVQAQRRARHVGVVPRCIVVGEAPPSTHAEELDGGVPQVACVVDLRARDEDRPRLAA